MHVIMTHEQADFDALAALLAASLLSTGSMPLLPKRTNRNTRKFLNLYGHELPFVGSDDLPAGNIKTITLVDTQSFITLKGITRETQFHVVDHHPLHEHLPEHWTRTIEKIGATTTLLVEEISKRAIPLTQVQATLLLLGIYEDTGSLAYAATSARDVRAAAYLLEQKADLRIAARFLNPALSDEQKAIAETLIQNAKTLQIQGKSILLSRGDASAMSEEISSIAHKIRDLFDPDALFLIVQTREGMRLIARSTNDEVNVARILAAFGGGGHERAASALLTEKSDGNLLEKIETCLVEVISDAIQPIITAASMMSRLPVLLTPQTTLVEAERAMQRYGYEGYPVVDGNKVCGLLTRRSIEKAVHHRLSLTAGDLMETGDHVLLPDDSLEHVRELMASTGWGQIPVVENESGKVIGIVTRTDLLKNLQTKTPNGTSTGNLGEVLLRALPACRVALLKAVIETAVQAHLAIYVVGGFVRDLLLNIPALDFDLVIEGDAIKLANSLAKQWGGCVVSHRRFGTAKWKIKPRKETLAKHLNCVAKEVNDLPDSLDLISARTEFYQHPTALPEVENSSIKQDLHRRDFTINTLAIRLDGLHFGELQDHWGGLTDLKKKQIKVLHSLSFVDDPTRMLRAIRFEQRFAFKIEKRTMELLLQAKENLRQVSGERIRHELDLVLTESDPIKVLARLDELGLLAAIHADLQWKKEWSNRIMECLAAPVEPPWKVSIPKGSRSVSQAATYLAWFAALDANRAPRVATRLLFSKELVDALGVLQALVMEMEALTLQSTSQFCERLENVPEISLFTFYMILKDHPLQGKILQYVQTWRAIEPAINGETLKEMGIPPGPRYSMLLKRIKNARLDGEVSDENGEKVLLERLLEEN